MYITISSRSYLFQKRFVSKSASVTSWPCSSSTISYLQEPRFWWGETVVNWEISRVMLKSTETQPSRNEEWGGGGVLFKLNASRTLQSRPTALNSGNDEVSHASRIWTVIVNSLPVNFLLMCGKEVKDVVAASCTRFLSKEIESLFWNSPLTPKYIDMITFYCE